jgi:phosphohistidine phosphatase
VQVFLVHHADAVGPEIDPQRPLSPAGVAHAERLATDAAARGLKPQIVWHSGKLRARQTAEAFWRRLHPLAVFAAQRGLQPTDPPQTIRDLLAAEDQDVLLVGHFPSLPKVLALLTRNSEDAAVSFPQHGLVALERSGNTWKEIFRFE